MGMIVSWKPKEVVIIRGVPVKNISTHKVKMLVFAEESQIQREFPKQRIDLREPGGEE